MKTAKRAKDARASRRRKPRLRLAVQYATRSRAVPAASQFERWIHAAIRGDAEVTVRIVGETEGRELNRAYRGKDYATNVLTFVMSESAPDERHRTRGARFRYEGDLALCAPIVAKEARAQGKDPIAHYAHLTVHGILHLQGYEHEGAREAEEMEALETRILKRLGYPDPYTAPTSNGRQPQ